MLRAGGDPRGVVAARMGITTAKAFRKAIANGNIARADRMRDRIRSAFLMYHSITEEIEFARLTAPQRRPA